MRFPISLSILTILILCPTYAGPTRLDLLGKDTRITVRPVPLNPDDPTQDRVGALTFLGGVALSSVDGAFGGFSSITVRGDRFTLLSDGGNVVRFRMGPGFTISDVRFSELPAGPGRGWSKEERDSESMTTDPAGNIWVGFERYNMIWRYGPDFAPPARGVRPSSMRKWPDNGGAESMVRLHDGRFLVIGETARPPHRRDLRTMLIYDRDPVAASRRGIVLAYKPPAGGFDPSDATQLPDGRLLVLNRDFSLPFRWAAVIVLVDLRDARPGAVLEGREVARFESPLTVDNYEGLAVTREGDATILWMISDDNQMLLERSLLLKFRVNLDQMPTARAPEGAQAEPE